MTDHAHELRRYARKIVHPAGDVPSVMLAAADKISDLTINVEYLGSLKKSYEELIEELQDERDALRAKIEAMEQQKPIAWARKLGLDLPSVGCVTDLKYRPSNIPESSYIPLYLAPGAQPAPSVPEDVMRDARRYLWLRNAALDWYVGPEYATYNDVVCSGEYCNYAGGGVALDSAIDALLAAAQEANP